MSHLCNTLQCLKLDHYEVFDPSNTLTGVGGCRCSSGGDEGIRDCRSILIVLSLPLPPARVLSKRSRASRWSSTGHSEMAYHLSEGSAVVIFECFGGELLGVKVSLVTGGVMTKEVLVLSRCS